MRRSSEKGGGRHLECLHRCADVVRCDRCQKVHRKKDWTRQQLYRRKVRQTQLVCHACRAEGFHPRDLKTYTCQRCSRSFGAKKFNLYMLAKYKKYARAGKVSNLICKECPLQLSCDRCKKAFDRQNWTRSEWNNKKYHKTRLVCRACRAEGYHAHDLRTYPCHACAGHFGAKKFNHNMVKNFKQRRRLGLECMSCIKDIIAVGVKKASGDTTHMPGLSRSRVSPARSEDVHMPTMQKKFRGEGIRPLHAGEIQKICSDSESIGFHLQGLPIANQL